MDSDVLDSDEVLASGKGRREGKLVLINVWKQRSAEENITEWLLVLIAGKEMDCPPLVTAGTSCTLNQTFPLPSQVDTLPGALAI